MMLAQTDFHPSFRPVRSQWIDALNLTAELYVHPGTGARHLHLRNDDGDNAFAVAFPTVPKDSTGVAHILEHTVLCGSARYPVRDPFFLMLRRSLATYMNAATASDFTFYPFSTQNSADFDNLLDVYLDAAFFPNLTKEDFLQEGIRVEPSNLDDPNSDLVFKGVVFNEMKGALGESARLTWETLASHLYSKTTYHYCSGGDPQDIPNLTHEALKEFHTKHYHPSNAFFVTYGSFSLADHQERINDRVLRHFSFRDLDVSIGKEQRYTAPVVFEGRYPLAPSETLTRRTDIVLGWLLGECSSPLEQLKAQLLEGILLNNSASPLRKALETTELASSPFPYMGIETGNKEAAFVCGVSGSDPEHAATIEQLILDVLVGVSEHGVPAADVEAVMHQLELDQRQVKTGQGRRLSRQSLPAILHGADPLEAMDIGPALAKLRQLTEDTEFVKGLVREVVDNPHRVRLTMKPDHSLAETMRQQEATRLREIGDNLSFEQRIALVEQAKRLSERQSAPMNVDVLPELTLDDVPSTRKIPTSTSRSIGEIPATWFDAPTNGLVTERVEAQIPALDPELLDLMPVFAQMLTEVGLGEASYEETQKRQSSSVSSLRTQVAARGNPGTKDDVTVFLSITGTGLTRNELKISGLVRETLIDARFDELDRLRDIVAQMRMSAEREVSESGHSMAVYAAAAAHGPIAALDNRWEGLWAVQFLKRLDESLSDPEALRDLGEKLTRIRDIVMTAPKQLVVVAEGKDHTEIFESLKSQWSTVNPGNRGKPFSLEVEAREVCELWTTTSNVSFAAKAYDTVPASHPDAPALEVLGPYLRQGFLHGAIREKGGAYGGGAYYNSQTGGVAFYSYRDPRSIETVADFDKSIEWLFGKEQEERYLREAILSTVASIDKPGSPADEAISTFVRTSSGRDPNWRQQYRRAVLNVTLEDLRRVAQTYLKGARAGVSVLSHEAHADAARHAGLEVKVL